MAETLPLPIRLAPLAVRPAVLTPVGPAPEPEARTGAAGGAAAPQAARLGSWAPSGASPSHQGGYPTGVLAVLLVLLSLTSLTVVRCDDGHAHPGKRPTTRLTPRDPSLHVWVRVLRGSAPGHRG